MIRQFFVYGTLKRGQRNERVWPTEATEILVAWAHGQLFGRSDYPAMKPGSDRVLGELWRFDETQVDEVFRALDILEGTNGNSPSDLYHRAVVETFGTDGKTLGNANTYLYVRDPNASGFRLIAPNDDSYVAWPADS